MNAVAIVDKPKGPTSHDIVTRVKRLMKVRKAGHAGTLDPMATGVLLVCLGEATKISRFLMGLEKEYLCTMKFGERTDTLDAEGTVTERVDGVRFDLNEVQEALGQFRGTIKQKPPMYSALKVNGTALHKLARKGIQVERSVREVFIKELDIQEFKFPYLTFRTVCSKGTYVRTLCDDLALALGTVGHMTGLCRTRIGGFSIDRASAPDELKKNLSSILQPEDAIMHLKDVILDDKDSQRARHGVAVRRDKYPGLPEEGYLRLKSSTGALFGIGEVRGDRVFVERILHLNLTA